MDDLELIKISELSRLPNNNFEGFLIIGTKNNSGGVPTSYAVDLTVLTSAIANAVSAAGAANNAADAANAAAAAFVAAIVQATGQNTDKVMSQKAVTDALGNKADKSNAVTDVSYDSTNKKLKKTVNGSTSDIVTLDTTPTANSTNPITSGAVQNAIKDFITKSVNDLTNYYLKSDTYTKTEVQNLIDAIKQFTYEVVATLPTASASTMNKIYLVPASGSESQNIKKEYITLRNGSAGSYTYSWEQIGDTSISLSGYVTTEQLNSTLASYVTTTALNTALADYLTSAAFATAIANYYNKTQVDAKFASLGLSVVSGKLCQTYTVN